MMLAKNRDEFLNEEETEIEFEELFLELIDASVPRANVCRKYCCIKPEKSKISKC